LTETAKWQITQVGEALPKGWAATTLGELRQDLSKSIEPKKHPDQAYELYSVPSFERRNPEITSGSDIGSVKRTVEKGVVLLCKINPRINRVWIVGDHTPNTKIASTEWIPFFPLPGLEPRFLSYFMQRSEFRDYLATNVSGVGGSLMRVKPSTIETYPFLLPPLNEQRRIVEKIEELFTKLDAGVQSLKQSQALLRSYRRSVLKAAVEGELSREWREAHKDELEPASELLERILQERRVKFSGKKYKEPASPDTSNLPALPDGWVWASPMQLASSDQHSLGIGPFGSSLKVEDYKDAGVPLIFVRNIRSRTFNADGTKYVTVEKAAQLKAHFAKGGDVLVTKMGDPPGDACLYPGNHPTAVVTADCIKWRLSPLLPWRQLFVHFINSPLVHNEILRITRGVAQLKVSLGRFSHIAIPLPPLEEQHFLVEDIERRLSVVDKLEATIEANLKQAEGLRQSILKRAFSGNLVPQDPNDEPASALLKRIRVEREAAKPKARKGRKSNATLTNRDHAEQEGLF
jgi:type I restriction enzyme, S subunit